MNGSLEERLDWIENRLLGSKEVDAIRLAKDLMKEEYVNLHGPEHHFLDGGALLVAIRNAGLGFDLEQALRELKNRTIKMPGAMCGWWGICGSAASIGAVFSILDGTGPLSSDDNYSDHMRLTSETIERMSEIGGPRCCKRNAFLSIQEGMRHANEKYGLNLPIGNIVCEFSKKNQQCIKERCPFHFKED